MGTGDPIEVLGRDDDSVSIAEFTSIYLDKKNDPWSIKRVLAAKHLSAGWKDYFLEQLAKLSS